jgi:hypothetical protein
MSRQLPGVFQLQSGSKVRDDSKRIRSVSLVILRLRVWNVWGRPEELRRTGARTTQAGGPIPKNDSAGNVIDSPNLLMICS